MPSLSNLHRRPTLRVGGSSHHQNMWTAFPAIDGDETPLTNASAIVERSRAGCCLGIERSIQGMHVDFGTGQSCPRSQRKGMDARPISGAASPERGQDIR